MLKVFFSQIYFRLLLDSIQNIIPFSNLISFLFHWVSFHMKKIQRLLFSLYEVFLVSSDYFLFLRHYISSKCWKRDNQIGAAIDEDESFISNRSEIITDHELIVASQLKNDFSTDSSSIPSCYDHYSDSCESKNSFNDGSVQVLKNYDFY